MPCMTTANQLAFTYKHNSHRSVNNKMRLSFSVRDRTLRPPLYIDTLQRVQRMPRSGAERSIYIYGETRQRHVTRTPTLQTHVYQLDNRGNEKAKNALRRVDARDTLRTRGFHHFSKSDACTPLAVRLRLITIW